MEMMLCKDCNCAFDEFNIVWDTEYETIEGRSFPIFEHACCPYCRSEEIEEAEECECCGEWVPKEDMHVDFEGFCNDCVKKTMKKIEKMIEAHGDNAMLKVFNYMAEVF